MLRRDREVHTPLIARGVRLDSFVSHVVQELRCADLIAPIRKLRVAIETDRALLHIVDNLIRMTAPRMQRVRAILFDIRRRADSGDLRELAFAE